MKLQQIAAKPQLIPFVIDDAEFVKEYGEPIEFYSWDRQPIEIFMKLANANTQDTASMIEIVRNLILDESGKAIIKDGLMLPNRLLIAVIGKVVETLGK